jgi:signal transduction histidine kinase/ActR/RegA family two-component response regulator
MEWNLRRRDGTVRQMLASGGIISFRGQRAVQGVLCDITTSKEAERAKERLQARLLQSQKLESLGILAGGIAHDFNNLLAVMFANVELAARSESLDPSSRTALADALSATESARLLTHQLLTYAGKQSTQPTLVDLSEQVKGLSGVLRSAVPGNVSLHLDLDPTLPAVRADLAQLQQVTMNLVLNAVEAIGDATGAVNIRTAARRLDETETDAMMSSEDLEPGECALLEVCDTGCGMDGETQRQLFDPFFTTKAAGHGLGMSAVLGTVRNHRGGITIESAPGRGTAIRVYLPAARRMESLVADPSAELAAEDLSGVGQVLVVDDDARMRRAARRMLQSGGYAVAEAENGRQALEVFERMGDEIDLVLLDLNMPEMGGAEALRVLRRQRPTLAVLVSSGFDDSKLADGLADPAHIDFLAKPYTMDDLLAKVKQLLRDGEEAS